MSYRYCQIPIEILYIEVSRWSACTLNVACESAYNGSCSLGVGARIFNDAGGAGEAGAGAGGFVAGVTGVGGAGAL